MSNVGRILLVAGSLLSGFDRLFILIDLGKRLPKVIARSRRELTGLLSESVVKITAEGILKSFVDEVPALDEEALVNTSVEIKGSDARLSRHKGKRWSVSIGSSGLVYVKIGAVADARRSDSSTMYVSMRPVL